MLRVLLILWIVAVIALGQESCSLDVNMDGNHLSDLSPSLITRENPFSIPSAQVDLVTPTDGDLLFEENKDLSSILARHNRAVLFAVPGAFTPTCSNQHFPGFVDLSAQLRESGVEAIYCLSVNDKFVMKAWASSFDKYAGSGVIMVADGNAAFTQALGMGNDRSANRMGLRSKRYALIVENGKIVKMFVDEAGLALSSAQNVLESLKQMN